MKEQPIFQYSEAEWRKIKKEINSEQADRRVITWSGRKIDMRTCLEMIAGAHVLTEQLISRDRASGQLELREWTKILRSASRLADMDDEHLRGTVDEIKREARSQCGRLKLSSSKQGQKDRRNQYLSHVLAFWERTLGRTGKGSADGPTVRFLMAAATPVLLLSKQQLSAEAMTIWMRRRRTKRQPGGVDKSI